MPKEDGKATLPKIDVDKELIADLQEIGQRKGHTMPQIRRRAYAQYVNTDRKERGQKPKHYKIAK
jgi:hypothetical protein